MADLRTLVDGAATLLELVGIGVILAGSLVATAIFLGRLKRRTPFADAYVHYRRGLGRAILLGLEFLVGADIIRTVAVEPNYYNLGVLALIVVVRTFLSFSLEVEIEGRWPWQRSTSSADAQRSSH